MEVSAAEEEASRRVAGAYYAARTVAVAYDPFAQEAGRGASYQTACAGVDLASFREEAAFAASQGAVVGAIQHPDSFASFAVSQPAPQIVL